MNPSEELKINIVIAPFLEGVRWELMNSDLKSVYMSTQETETLILDRGIYLIKLEYLRYFQQEYLAVNDSKTYNIELKYSTPIPIFDLYGSSEPYFQLAERSSLKSMDDKKEGKPNFFFYAAKYFGHSTEGKALNDWMGSYSLYQLSGGERNSEIILNESEACVNHELGIFCFSTRVEPGLYFLHYKKPLTNKPAISGDRIFPVYITEGYQTQYFIRYNEEPDFVNTRLFITDSECFNHEDEAYCTLEKVLMVFDSYENIRYISNNDEVVIRNNPFLVSLMLAAHQMYNVNGGKYLQMMSLAMPDLNEADKIDPNQIPLLSYMTSKIVFRSDANPKVTLKDMMNVITPASLIDRVMKYCYYDSIWTSFSDIDNPLKWKSIYLDVFNNKTYKNDGFFDRYVGKYFDKRKDQINSSVSYLTGSTTQDNTNLKINSEFLELKEFNDIRDMSNEFNVPSNLIIRDYEFYKDKYTTLLGQKRLNNLEMASEASRKWYELESEKSGSQLIQDHSADVVGRKELERKMKELASGIRKAKNFNLKSDDLQKGMWGKKSMANGYTLRAQVTNSEIWGYFDIYLEVFDKQNNQVKEPVAFFVHNTFGFEEDFALSTLSDKGNGLSLVAYEAFALGALLQDKTELELDLNEVPGYPEKFYWQANKNNGLEK